MSNQVFFSFFTDPFGNTFSNLADKVSNSQLIFNDDGIELGLRFYSTISGYVAGINFLKASNNASITHVCNLYDSSGNNIGTTTTSNEGTGGWEFATFTNPILISANTIYTVSYRTRVYYSYDNYFTDADAFEGPLVAPQGSGNRDVTNAGLNENGVFYLQNKNYNVSVYPNSSNLSANYWVDVNFMITLGQSGLTKEDLAALPATSLFQDGSRSFTTQNQITLFFTQGSYSQQAGLASNPNLTAEQSYIFNSLILAQIPYFPMSLLTISQISALNQSQLSLYIDPLNDTQLQALKASLSTDQRSALLFNPNLTNSQRTRINIAPNATVIYIVNSSPYTILTYTSSLIQTAFNYQPLSKTFDPTTVNNILKTLNSAQLLALRTNPNWAQLNPMLASYVEPIPNPNAVTNLGTSNISSGHLQARAFDNLPTIMRLPKSNNFTVSILNNAGNAWTDLFYPAGSLGYENKGYNLCLSFKKISN